VYFVAKISAVLVAENVALYITIHTIDWGTLFGVLNPGEYRLLKDVTHSRAPGDYDKYVLAAEFSITE